MIYNHINTALKLFILLSIVFSNNSFAVLPGYVNGQELPSLAPMLEKSMPAVVNISTTKNVKMRENPLLRDPFFRHFFQLPQQQKRQ
jgi:serine protease Do/serine protease DegQ